MPDEPDFEGPCGPTLICVISPTVNFEDPFDPGQLSARRDDLGVHGVKPVLRHDRQACTGVDGLTIERNPVTSSDCSAIFTLFVADFHIERNDVSASVNCSTIDVAACRADRRRRLRNTATDGGFTGINADDVTDLVIDRNASTGNCIGIVAGDSPGPLSSSNVSITRNSANANNTVCSPVRGTVFR